MFVSDFAYNRVLHFASNNGRFTPGQSADGVIGQPDLVSYKPNQGAGENMPSPTTLSRPSAARPEWDWTGLGIRNKWEHLYVADYGNGRVTQYNWYGRTSNANIAAEAVIGAPDLTTPQPSGWPNMTGNVGEMWCDKGFGPDALCAPVAVTFDNLGNMLVSDWGGDVVRQFGPPDYPGNQQNFGSGVFNGLASWGEPTNYSNVFDKSSVIPATPVYIGSPGGTALDYGDDSTAE